MKRKIWLLAAVLSLSMGGASRAAEPGEANLEGFSDFSEGQAGPALSPEMEQWIEPIQFTFQHFTDRDYASLEPGDYEPLIYVLRERDGGGLTAAEFIKMNDFERHTLLEKTLPKMRSRMQVEAILHAAWLEARMNDPKELADAFKATERRKQLMKVWGVEAPADFKKAYNKAQSHLADYQIDATRKALGVDEALASLKAEPVGSASASAGQSKDEAKAQKLLKRFTVEKVGETNIGLNHPFGPNAYVGYDTAVSEAIDALKKAVKMDERSQHIVLNGLLQYSRQIRASGKESGEHDANEVLGLIYELGAKSSHESVLRSVMETAIADTTMGTWGVEKEYKRYPAWVDQVKNRRLKPETRPVVAAYFLDQAKKADKLEDKKDLIGIARGVVEAPAPVQLADVPPPTLAKRALFTMARHSILMQAAGLFVRTNPTAGPVSAFLYVVGNALVLGGIYLSWRRKMGRGADAPFAMMFAGALLVFGHYFTAISAASIALLAAGIPLAIAGLIWGMARL